MKILEGVIPPSECMEAVDRLKDMVWKEGVTFDKEYADKVKNNFELRITDDMRVEIIEKKLESFLWKDIRFKSYTHPQRLVKPRFNKYMDGGFYGKHADAFIMNGIRSDLSMTMFLSHPDDYEGGELSIESEGLFHKGKQGSIVLYPSHYVHEVMPVTKGERICMITWIQSMVRNEQMRELASRAYQFGADLKDHVGMCDLYIEYTSIYNNLMRHIVEN